MNKLDTKYRSFSPKRIVKPFYISIAFITLIFLATIFYVLFTNSSNFIKYQVSEFENLLIQSKKDFIQTQVDAIIQDIEIEEHILLTRLEKENQNLLHNRDAIDSIVKEEIYLHIHNTKLINSGYIWVNEILNYEGGDNYAIRLIHPNLNETEGMLLSTNMTDVKGNKPYLTELNGVKKDGKLFFNYWFKKPNSEKIAQKLTYARLYKKYNWIIATGIYLDDVDALVAAELEKGKKMIWNQISIILLVLLFSLIIAFLTIHYFKKRITTTINFYTKEVDEREKLLQEFNTDLEKLVKKRTEQLNESELRYGSLFKKNQSVMLLLDPETGLIVDANEAAVQFYGYTFKQLTSMSLSEINTLPLDELKSTIKDVLSSKLKHFYFKHKIANGAIKDVEVYSEKIRVGGKDLLYSIVYDISELKKTQKELIVAKNRAEESDRLKSAFLTNMSHEIRTPMNGILGFSNLLKNPSLSGNKQQEYIKIIEKSGERMLNIINNIVDISKIESGLMKVKLEETNINHQIEFIYNFFKPEVKAKGLTLIAKNGLPENKAIIKTDTEKVYAILTNLVKNAIKYTAKGTIEFGYIKKEKYLEFYVKDTGIGIPEDRKKAIFERFVQADIYDKMARQGAGLGLTISKAFIEILGGEIRVESEEGIGSTFYVTLPYTEEKKTISNVENTLEELNATTSKINGLKILITEDDETSEALLSIAIEGISSEIISAKTGIEAIEKIKKNPDIDVILMDIQMPEMNGYEATKQIRTFNKNVIIIAQTAFGLAGDKEKAVAAGCNDYISKPIKTNQLIALIEKLVSGLVAP
ncbi:PAS domain S-box-containing protein [Lutibacter agarilyticus]|uniref:histidine kinase n=1 Tax=Lutibacter agarilyticus TaxID=1109740 RepID=A0A238W1S8_9FLAO|nr:ATP-binding protein [Lutibacter agarilyticus]SNR40458.1 PAS domain S-box-containing protein [Lutibacter agarilyticus]